MASAALCGAAVGAVALTLAVLSPGGTPAGHHGTSGSRLGAGHRSTPVTGAATTATTRPPRPRAARIASLGLTLDEPASASVATGHSSAGAPVRVLPTRVRFPAPASGSAPVVGAPFPLVVFSEGFNEPADAYAALLDSWARAGYVVAAPTYPYTDPSSPTGVNESDIVNHPADLRYVIAALRGISRKPGSPLHGVLDPTRVAIAGQSDGGDVSLAVADNSCCRAAGVRAAIILSGAELAAFGGTYFAGSGVPLLVTQGNQDTINPPGCSIQLYDQAPQPKYYLNIAGAEHLAPYVSPGPIRAGIGRATVRFLNAYLKHGPAGAAGLSSLARLPPEETLTSGSAAPGPPSTYCPGAP